MSNTAWKEDLKAIITDPLVLLNQLELDPSIIPDAQRTVLRFPLRVTASFVSRMRKGDLQDPLLKQVLPLTIENKVTQGFVTDPLQEEQNNPVPGLLHKYKGRVLMTVTGGCAIHCRYCFRRHFPYSDNTPGRKLDKILDYISKDNSIQEVILSGGDPLTVSDDYLSYLLEKLAMIAHLKTVRIHTRLPIVLPSRIHKNFTQLLTDTRLRPVVVIHCNHPQEIDDMVMKVLIHLARSGVRLFNQSVLLKNINDNVAVLTQLSHRLFDCQVMPYYLHILDKVQGSSHFDVDPAYAKHLYYELRKQLPGYLVPLLVKEEPGVLAKSPIV